MSKKEGKREEGVRRDEKRKEGKNNEKTCHLLVLFLCVILWVLRQGKRSKKKETYTGRSLFDISKFKIKNVLRIT